MDNNDTRRKWAIGCTKFTKDKVDNQGELLQEYKSMKRSES